MQLNTIYLNGDSMNITIKNTLKAALLIIILLLVSSIFLNILYYLNIIATNILKYFKLILSVIAFFVGGFYMGTKSPNKGYLYGLRLSLIMIILTAILSIVFNNIDIKRIIYFLIMTACITFGSMIGINKKNN